MNIGLIAHDSKKKLMQNFCIAYRGILNKHELYATGTTGRLIEEVTNLNVHKYIENKKRAATKLGCTVRTINNLSLNTRNRERRDSCMETVEDCPLLQFL